MPIRTRAPYRTFDCGGWTDTSFMPGGEGACCNVAISLYIYIDFEPNNSNQLIVTHRANNKRENITLPFRGTPKTLAEAAVAALKLPASAGGNITVESDVPPGSGLGGSASYSVALLAALSPALHNDRHKLAALAQELETKWLGNSCGTQDQMAAAYGGISYSEIRYPSFTHATVTVNPSLRDRLEQSLLLVYTGEAHFSSEMHHTVLAQLKKKNPKVVNAFYHLKTCGEKAAQALRSNEFSRYKTVLNENWEAQKALHPDITTPAIESLYAVAKEVDPTAAFKGSGAGGGGSVALLVEPSKKTQLIEAIQTHLPSMKVWSSLTIDSSGADVLTGKNVISRLDSPSQRSLSRS